MKTRDINSVGLEGNLAGDCLTKTIGDSVLAKFRLCVSNGERPTTYIDCEWWNPSGAVKYLKRGKKVYISGRLLQNNWEDKDTGSNQHKYFISVRDLELRLNAVRRDDDKEDVSNEDAQSSDSDIQEGLREALGDVPF